MKKCPYCAEDVQEAAIVCRHCGRDLSAPARPPQVAVNPNSAWPWCKTCQRQTPHTPEGQINHILHFLVGFLTCSVWWFVWLLIVLTHKPGHVCSQCGTRWTPVRTEFQPPPPRTAEEIAAARVRSVRALKLAAGAALALVALFAGLVLFNAWGAEDRRARARAEQERAHREVAEAEAKEAARRAAAGPSPTPARPAPMALLPSRAPSKTAVATETGYSNEQLAQAVRATGSTCPRVTRQFFQGTEKASGTRFINVRCAPGGDYAISTGPGGGKVLECSVLKAAAGVTCFVPF